MSNRILPLLLGWLSAMAVGALAGCGPGGGDGAEQDKLKIAASIPPQKWLIERIAGDRADVFIMLPPGASPHAHAPTDRDATRVIQSRVYFSIGVEFEEKGRWFRAVEQAASDGRLSIINTQMGIPLRRMEDHVHGDDVDEQHRHEHDHDQNGHGHDHDDHDHDDDDEHHHHHHHDGDDPHIWTSPRLLRLQARTIAAALAAVDPEHRRIYERNLRSTLDELTELEREIRAKLEPHRGGAMLVYHPAWGYFTEAFGLRQVPVEISGRQPTDAELTRLLRAAREEGTRTVFVQPQISGAAAQAVADQIDGQVVRIDPLAEDVAANLRQVARRLAESFE